MTLKDRINYCRNTCNALQATNSRIEKQAILDAISEDYADDMNVIFETLDGKHPIGWTFEVGKDNGNISESDKWTIRNIVYYLENMTNKTSVTCRHAENDFSYDVRVFIAPIVNRTLALGIKPLDKASYSPMLAERHALYDIKLDKLIIDTPIVNYQQIFITQKFDGFRCLVFYDDGWKFKSRDNKDLPVDFLAPMCEKLLSRNYVFDGELICVKKECDNWILTHEFEVTSGNVRAGRDSDNLCFIVFDAQMNEEYQTRRFYLTHLLGSMKNERIILAPVLYQGRYCEVNIKEMIKNCFDIGVEGLMINIAGREYEQKRSTAILKVKMQDEIDMFVDGFEVGKRGKKYEGLVGSLKCSAFLDGKNYECKVSSGLSDGQRRIYLEVLPRMITVQYQSKRELPSGLWSLRHPRLIRVRLEKGFKNVEKKE